MKTTANMKTSLLRRAAALILAAALAVPTVHAAAGERKLQTTATLTEGLTYRNTVTVNNSSRIESFTLEREPDSEAVPILLQSAGTVYGAATINRAVSLAQEQGYHVLGAVNTDFFSTASGVPIGIVIEDGVYKSSSEEEAAMLITDGQVSLLEKPEVELLLTNARTGAEVKPHHLNKWRSPTGGLYLLNEHFSTVSTRTSTAGWHVRMKQAQATDPKDPFGIWKNPGSEPQELTVNSTLTLEVTEVLQTDQPTQIGPDEYILTADDQSGYLSVFEGFQVGDQITLTASCEDEALSDAQWAGGVGDVIVQDGAVTDSTHWTYVKDGRAPRTALGVKEDGTLLLYAADGRQSGYSMGLSEADLASEMQAQGCDWAVNLDGGGSTAMSVWVPGKNAPALQNKPSDGRARSCATFLLFVTEDGGDGEPVRLAMESDGLTVLTGSSLTLPKTVALDSGLNILDEPLEDLEIEPEKELGEIAEGVYTAGERPGTERLRLTSEDLDAEGTAQLHVVDALTELNVSRQGQTAPLTALSVKPGDTVQLAVTGSYWGREALRGWEAVTWESEGQAGTVDETGLFTAPDQAGSGTLTARAGGLSQTIQVTVTDVHADVPQDHWAYDSIEYCYNAGIVGGISATEFGLDLNIRRADFLLMLYGAVGRPDVTAKADFTDVAETDYYYTALSWGQSVGLASGTGDGAYSPNASITREQAFTILRQALPLLGKVCPDAELSVLERFADKDRIAGYAQAHTATLVAQGLVSGRDAGIDPQGNLTRAEMAVLLAKSMTYTPIQNDPDDPDDPDKPDKPDDSEKPDKPDDSEKPDKPDDSEKPDKPDDSEKPDKPDDSEPPVDPAEYSMTLEQNRFILTSGGSAALKARIDPAVEDAKITWSSSDPKAAAVSPSGVVTNLFAGQGSPTVTITASWRGLTASCLITCLQAERTGTVTGAENGLNIRSGPGTSYSVIGGLDDGSQVVVLHVQDGWCQILCQNGEGQVVIGYVSGNYITLSPAG